MTRVGQNIPEQSLRDVFNDVSKSIRNISISLNHEFFPNYWITMTLGLAKSQERFTTEGDLPIQTLGHIQHTCEALSELHTMTHHRCWRLIHGELSRLAPSKWRFVCINSEKCFRTGTGSGISSGFRSMCRTNALRERGKRYGIETSPDSGGRNTKKDMDPT